MKKLLFLFAAILAIVAGPRANAQAHLDFTVPSLNGGTFSWGGNGTPLVGTSIDVTEVAGTDTPLHSGTLLAITGGLMNVTTGAGTFVPPPPPGPVINFAGGGAITITGSIPGGSSEALLSGTVSSATLSPLTGQAVLDVTAFTNSIAADLAGFFWPSNDWLVGGLSRRCNPSRQRNVGSAFHGCYLWER